MLSENNLGAIKIPKPSKITMNIDPKIFFPFFWIALGFFVFSRIRLSVFSLDFCLMIPSSEYRAKEIEDLCVCAAIIV